ncbi:hypothetical protein GOP47_0024804 [Adiantum capillus-veneris]|uniref:UspA domain-containing protein n=1 Tax=Adiantum capillus-veneris TaxID=13818 RepID=A0A9D4Z3Z4_ADICA|nr:hypothetical protein GOP47_0024804 [Adiantum capillus-veneris]
MEQNDHHHQHAHDGHHDGGRSILVAVDHSLHSKHAFDWVVSHLCRPHDTLHLLHVLPDSPNDKSFNTAEGSPRAVFESTSALMERFAVEAYETAMVKTEVLILTGGEVGKAIVQEARRISPIAVVIGKNSRGFLKSVLHGSISEYCSHHCPCPLVLVPPKESCDQSNAT